MSTSAPVDAEATTGPDAPNGGGPGGPRTWFAALGGIGAWMVHLIAVAALARISCTHSSATIWWTHGATLITALVTLGAMALSEALRRAGPSESDPAPVDTATVTAEGYANLEFLGRFGLIVGGFSLLLIVFEGSMAVWLSACH
ncbi:MAG: hypothetical protein ACR2G7_01100 [Acidimicrobiales bacterium]